MAWIILWLFYMTMQPSLENQLVQFNVLNVTRGLNNQSFIQFDILLQRMYFYHLAATYLPTMGLLIIAEITISIYESHFDTTIMVSLTSMLAMYTLYQSIAGTLPKTAYLKMIVVWLLIGLMLPFGIFLFQVLNKLLKQTLDLNDSNNVKLLSSSYSHPKTSKQLDNKYKCVRMFRKGTRICLPLITVSFIIIFCPFALQFTFRLTKNSPWLQQWSCGSMN